MHSKISRFVCRLKLSKSKCGCKVIVIHKTPPIASWRLSDENKRDFRLHMLFLASVSLLETERQFRLVTSRADSKNGPYMHIYSLCYRHTFYCLLNCVYFNVQKGETVASGNNALTVSPHSYFGEQMSHTQSFIKPKIPRVHHVGGAPTPPWAWRPVRPHPP